ncbi:MAG: dehydrogenase [Peptococcaceae bacterium BICA1-7]|nr:MAG: dehydrogenase [Peptococcaceae bacterium BICA1-7]HBV98699.1 glutathione-dependent formaldehyde dehydrogenase [Desulfotomaculum sp.]
MRAITYQGVKDVKVNEVHDPKIEKPDDAIIKVTSTAICGSDLHLIHGLVANMPTNFILGHEAMGLVEEVGPEVHEIKKGDRVIIPFPVACGRCWYCEHHFYSQCNNSNPHGEAGGIFGYSETYGGYAGGQAEYLRVPYANVGPLKVPEDLSDEQVLFLTDILPTAYWGNLIGGVKEGSTVTVLGCGPVGLLAQKFAWILGAERVIAVDYIGYRLDHAKKHNKVEVINFEDHESTGGYIKEITGGGTDVVIDCVGMDGKMNVFELLETALFLQGGAMSAIIMASQAVRKCGTVALVGVYGLRYNQFPLGDFFSRNITLKMGQCPATAYAGELLEWVKEGKIDPTDIITHRIKLDEGEKGYEIFDQKQDNCIKVVMSP